MIVTRGDRVYLCCDACPKTIDAARLGTERDYMRAVRRAAELEGWAVKETVPPTSHFCADCSRTPLLAVTVHLPAKLTLCLDLAGARFDRPVSRGYMTLAAAKKGAVELGCGYEEEV